MKIDRIELFHVAMPLLYPWRTAYGEDTAIESVLCRISSGSVDAWGESSPLAAPCYSPEWAGGVFATARKWFGPALLGQDITSGLDLQQRLGVFKGNPFAKAVFDSAWWALSSKIANTSLHELLGAERSVVPVGADFGVMDSIDELVEAIGPAVEQGFLRTKLKYRPGWDIPMLTAVRRAFPDHRFHIDCNSGYRLDDLPMFQELDSFQLAMIEQPLAHDDLLDHAQLQQSIATPVCLDESVAHMDRARQALAFNCCQFVNIKPGRVGGLTIAKLIHDHCRDAGVPCWVGGMLESACGAAHCVALAMLDNFTYPADIFPSSRFYADDLSDPPIELQREPGHPPSVVAPTQLPEPVEGRLAEQTLQHVILS